MSRARRRIFTPEQKAAIVKQNIIGKIDIGELCEEHQIQPSRFYQWRTQLFENAAMALQDRRRTRHDPQKRALEAEQRKVEVLESELARKDHVIAKLAEENVDLKKAPGGR